MQIKFAIPTYQRADKQLSLKMLKDFGYTKDEIIMSTQTEEDYKAYKEKYDNDCTIIYKEGHSVTENRNTLIDYFDKGQWVIMLDDDIQGFFKLSGKGLKKIETREEIEKMFNDFFEYTEKNNGRMWGVYPCKNAFFMKQSINKKDIINSCLGLIIDQRFDEELKTKEDIELCCRYIKSGYNIIRFNFITYDVKHKQKGGCCEVWKSEINDVVAKKLVAKYPKLLKLNSRRKGEVLYCGTRK